ncbi:hypothetical protein [Luteolibacter marinus]|uniref:hypothetical protein n=1 Tax=Luteolibacter marinus TaxID=2776705 RepID=UPI0018664FD8|nr:hypothetical protein [Luteolibacter marinus]
MNPLNREKYDKKKKKPNIMRNLPINCALSIASIATLCHAAPENLPDGIEFGDPDIYLKPDAAGNLSMTSDTASIFMWSDAVETTRYDYLGGLHFLGDPVRIHLGTVGTNDGVFEVVPYWDSLYAQSNPALFSIDSTAETASFNNVDVSISGGSLTVGGNAVLDQSNAASYLSGQGFLQLSGFDSALSAATPPTSTAWQATYVPRGSVSNGGSLALGTSTASGSYALANGLASVASGSYSEAQGDHSTASGIYSTASGYWSEATSTLSQAYGYQATASGPYSYAAGNNVTSEGLFSFAYGLQVSAKSASEVVFGRFGLESSPINIGSFSDLDGLFRLSNGINDTSRSDALTVLKNGQTTLTNKAWKAAVTADPEDALEDPSPTTDSGGEALVVDGHTRLNGKVIISVPQGDISMGVYGD